jgi:hypothetical protein
LNYPNELFEVILVDDELRKYSVLSRRSIQCSNYKKTIEFLIPLKDALHRDAPVKAIGSSPLMLMWFQKTGY